MSEADIESERLRVGRFHEADWATIWVEGSLVHCKWTDPAFEPIWQTWLENGIYYHPKGRQMSVSDLGLFLEAIVSSLANSSYWGYRWEGHIKLGPEASRRLAELHNTSTIKDGKTYADRMREKAEEARRGRG